MLKVENLVVRYGMIEAIKGISFEVNDGEIVTLIGANGAGKTTTMHTISGLLKPAEGSILLDGVDITKIPAHKIVTMGLAQIPVEEYSLHRLLKKILILAPLQEKRKKELYKT